VSSSASHGHGPTWFSLRIFVTRTCDRSSLHHDVLSDKISVAGTCRHSPEPRIKAALVSPESTIRHAPPSSRLCALFFSCQSFLGWPPPCQPQRMPSRTSTITTDLIHPWRQRCPSRVVHSLTKCVFFSFACTRHDQDCLLFYTQNSHISPAVRVSLGSVSSHQRRRIQPVTPSVGWGVPLVLSSGRSRPRKMVPSQVHSSLNLTVGSTCASTSPTVPLLPERGLTSLQGPHHRLANPPA
jgi:hypothetical protein